MDKLQQLWEIADEFGVFATFAPLQKKNPGLLGIYISDWPAIFLDESIRNYRRIQKCILAEEIGHHLTVPRTDFRRVYRHYTRYGECNETIMFAQDERRALRWATGFLIPDVELCRALAKGYRSCYELAEHFDVTEWFVYRKLEFLKAEFMLGRQTAC